MTQGQVRRYRIQQDRGRYCLKGCDDGDLVDWGEYAALQRQLATLRAALHTIATDCEERPIDAVMIARSALGVKS